MSTKGTSRVQNFDPLQVLTLLKSPCDSPYQLPWIQTTFRDVNRSCVKRLQRMSFALGHLHEPVVRELNSIGTSIGNKYPDCGVIRSRARDVGDAKHERQLSKICATTKTHVVLGDPASLVCESRDHLVKFKTDDRHTTKEDIFSLRSEIQTTPCRIRGSIGGQISDVLSKGFRE